jgi:hypothetical protein
VKRSSALLVDELVERLSKNIRFRLNSTLAQYNHSVIKATKGKL